MLQHTTRTVAWQRLSVALKPLTVHRAESNHNQTSKRLQNALRAAQVFNIMETDYNLRNLKIGDDYVPPPPNLRPWFFPTNSSPRLQALFDLESPPTLHPALITAHCVNRSLKILCGAPPIVKTVGDVYFPTSAAQVSALEDSAVGFFKVQDVDLVIDRGEGREEIGGRAIVFLGGTKQLESMIAEARRDGALWEAKGKGFGDGVCAWAEAVEEGDWEEAEVVWERVGRRVERRRTWG